MTLASVMQLITTRKPLPHRLGDFATLIIVLATQQTASAMCNGIAVSLFSSTGSGHAGMDQLCQNAVGVIEALWPADSSPASNDILRSSLECHLSLTLMLLHCRRRDLLSFVRDFTMRADDSEARASLVQWVKKQGGQRARAAAAHAGRLLATLRRCPTGGFHEAIAVLLAILLLWSYNQLLSEEPSFSPRQAVDEQGLLERGSVIRLDGAKNTADIRAWCQNAQPGMKPYLQGVGSIVRPGAGVKIIELGQRLLKDMHVWGLGQGFASRLGKMQANM